MSRTAARRFANVIAAQEVRITELERRLENMIRPGPITDVDPAKQQARIRIGRDADGTEQKGPWVSYAQHAGALKGHTPPTEGQQMMHVSPNGDVEQGWLVPLGWSDANPSPGTTADHVWTYLSKIKISLADGKIAITVPDMTMMVDGDHAIHLTKDGLKVTGPIQNAATASDPPKTLDATHTHQGVVPGGGKTGQVA